MKIQRRLLAAVAALAIVVNQSVVPIYAEETTTSSTTTETTSTATSAETTESSSDSTEATTSSTIESTNESSTEGTTTIPTEASTSSESTSETTETSHEQVSPEMPSLDFSIQDAWQWKKDTADWKLSYNADTTDLYYKVGSEYIDTSSGYTDGIAWNGFEQLSDGDYWIVFWAVDKENPELVTQSNQLEYKLDRTGISRFTIKKEDGKETPQHTKELIVSNINPILVSASGIKDNQIKYSIESDGQVQDYYLTVNGEDKQVTLVDGVLNFNISLASSYENATITVIIEDGVGNIESAQLNGVSHDSVVPVVSSINFVYPTFNDDDTDEHFPTWHDLKALPFGDDRLESPNNRTEYTYMSDKSFLKVKIEDDFKDLTIKATINDRTIDYNADDLLSVDGDYSATNGNEGTFYIPLKDSDFGLEAGKLYTVSVSAVDSKNIGNTIIAEDILFYDSYSELDSTISNPVMSGNYNTKYNGSYSYLGLDPQYDEYDAIFKDAGTATNSISVTMQDDVGLSEYEILIECNGTSKVVTGTYSKGIEKTTEIVTTTVVTDEDNNESVETSKTEVKYYTQATETITEKILLSEDGDYKITITVIDLAGNVRKTPTPLRYYVDTKAPSIQDPNGKFTYTVEQGMLNYFTFGIFGSETIRISVPVTENGSGIKTASLYWAPETDSGLAEYKGHYENGRIVFSELPTSDVKLSAVPTIIITDFFENKNVYYFQTPDEHALASANAEGIEGAILVLEKNPPIIKMTPSGDRLDVIDEKLFFGDATNSKLSFELTDSDDTGILRYSLIIKDQMGQIVYSENEDYTSGVINADGNIVEDSDIHARTSSIDIHEDVETDKTDAAQVPLYNRNIPLTITVKDTFSGISTIEWSIANDNESGTISVSPSGDINGNGVSIGDTETDSNLVTSIKFTLSVDDNSNGNIVKIVLADRSGNISEASKTYSIDTTAPTVTAGIANGTAHNGSYYNSDLTVNIAITERNFNGGEVQVTLNGNTQTVQWDDDGSAVGQDGTVHHASFPINGDGDYTYSVSYTDRAGNAGNTVSSDKFTIDKKAPEATITFDVGDDTKDDVYYNSVRTATFAVEEHNYGSAVIKITKDGTDVSGSYELNNWKPNDHSGDNHTQSVTLKEESGYYQVSITVTDMAGNSFQTSSKKFYIDLAAPEVHINVENVKNGAPSNDKTITPSISIVDHEGNLDPESISLKVTVVKLTDENEIKSFTALDYHGLSAWKDGDGSIKLDNENSPNEISFNMNNLEEDGIYTIIVSASDLAGNTGGQSSEDKQNGSEYKLSVNRLGSTYEVDDKIVSKDPELRYYQNSDGSPFTFTITEYNVNTLNPTDTIVKITCDGNVVDNQVKATEETGDNTWSKYTYEFPSELFENSGKYIIKLYSVDAAGNENPLEINGDNERATVTFFIDNINPEVHFRDADDKTEFTNEDPYRTDLKHIEVEVYDNSMQEAQDVVFKLNGEELSVNHDAGSMIYTFDIPSKTSLQTLNMTLKDIAGNETDTGVEDFLITTNVFILWFKNTPLFIGTILALLTAIGGIVFAVVRKKPRGFN